MDQLRRIAEWLAWIESFPIVPRWRWTPSAWQRWADGAAERGLPCCRDAYGNVLLGSVSVESWYAKIRDGARLCLQSHLDHPGALIPLPGMPVRGGQRLSALLPHGWGRALQGRMLSMYDADGVPHGETLIDQTVEGLRETWGSCLTAASVQTPAYLHGPAQNAAYLQSDRLWEGWGLDDHVGCAIVCHLLATRRAPDCLGVLTLDEEIGGHGARHLVEAGCAFGVARDQWPLLLSIEVTGEYPAQQHACGRGAQWRAADRLGPMHAEFLTWLQTCGTTTPVALERGACEAGWWSRAVGPCGCLAIPCRYAHNGVGDREWRAEQVDRTDVASAVDTLELVLAQWPCRSRPVLKPAAVHRLRPATLKIHDHVALLRSKVNETTDYLTALHDLFPAWNETHARFALPLLRLRADEWPERRTTIRASAHWASRIRALVTAANHKVTSWLGRRSHGEEVPIHLFLGAPFNACNLGKAIALSVDRLAVDDLERIVCHELTHWWAAELLALRPLRPSIVTAIHEGLACLATVEILGLSLPQAIGVSAADWQKFSTQERELKMAFRRWLDGALWHITEARHTIVRSQLPAHPFAIGSGGSMPKYGYYLGLRFVQQRSRSGAWSEWCRALDTDAFLQFLAADETPARHALATAAS